MKSFEKLLGIGVFALFVIFVAIAGYKLLTGNPNVQALSLFVAPVGCHSDGVAAYLTDLDRSLEIWDDNLKLADSTARIALSGAIDNLLQQKHRLMEIEAPECANYITELATYMMDMSIDPFLAFMQEKDDSQINLMFDVALAARAIFDDELAAFRESPRAAYRLANEGTVSTLSFSRSGTWQESNHAEFSFDLPAPWESNPDANMYSAKIKNDMTFGEIEHDVLSKVSKTNSARLNLATVETQHNPFRPQYKSEHLLLGDNEAYLVYAGGNGDSSVREIVGVVIVPDGTVFSIEFSNDRTGLKQDEQNLILGILASLKSL